LWKRRPKLNIAGSAKAILAAIFTLGVEACRILYNKQNPQQRWGL